MKGRRNGTLDAQQKAFIYSAVSCTRFSQYDLSCPWKHLCCCTNCSDCDFNKIPFRLIAMKIRYSPIVLKVSLNPNQSNICAMCPVKAPMWCVALIEQFHFIFWPSVTRRGANLQQFFCCLDSLCINLLCAVCVRVLCLTTFLNYAFPTSNSCQLVLLYF